METTDMTQEEYIEYLKNRLIPDLKEAGQLGTAMDFETCIKYMEKK